MEPIKTLAVKGIYTTPIGTLEVLVPEFVVENCLQLQQMLVFFLIHSLYWVRYHLE